MIKTDIFKEAAMNHKNYEGLPLFRDMEESRIREILLIAGCYIRNFKKAIIFMKRMKSSAA